MTPNHNLRAKWVVPGDASPIENGLVKIRNGIIETVAPIAGPPPPDTTDLGDVVLLPGFVNAHTHLELTGFAGRIQPPTEPGEPLLNWMVELVRLQFTGQVPAPDHACVQQGLEQSLRAGVTTIGDISRTNLAWPVLKKSPIRKVCFAELISIAHEPPATPEQLEAQIDAVQRDERLIPGLAPHTPFTVTGDHLRGCFDLAQTHSLPITLHLAESRSEVAWLAGEPGPIGEFLTAFGAAGFTSPHCGPVEYLQQVGGFAVPTLLAHANYVTDDQMNLLAESKCSVAYCPRTHAYFSHSPHRFQDMIERGINVCVATDSLASAPSLSVLDEMRFLRSEDPALASETLLRMGTLNGARALSADHLVGSLTPGKQADLVAVPLEDPRCDDPIKDLLTGTQIPTAVYVAGQPV